MTNCDTFADEGTMDYDDEGGTTIIPESTTTLINISMSTTSADSELSTTTMKNLGQNNQEMSLNQTLSIFSLKNMESKFNDLIVKLDHEQINYLNDIKNSSKFLEHEYKGVIKSYNQSIMIAFEDFSKHFDDYKKVKEEVEEKALKIRENYIREILTIEMNWISDQINFYKEHSKLVDKKRMFETMEKLYKNDNNTEKLKKIKDDYNEVDKKMENDSINLRESHQNFLNQTKIAELKLTNNLTKLLNDTKYNEISKNFENLLKLKKIIESLLKICNDYSSKSNAFITDFTKKLSNLNSKLVLSQIMPSDNEIVKVSQKVSLTKKSQNLDKTSYKWIQSFQGNQKLSENAVVGGQDVDGVPFYVARIKDYKSYLYGKFAFSSSRKHAYFPYENVEYGVEKFEILTAPNYIWCNFDKTKNYDELPICQAEHNLSVIPGTLQKNGICRIGYDFKVYRYSSDNIKVLSVDGC